VYRVGLVAAFALHLGGDRVEAVGRQLHVRGSDVARVDEVGGIADHGPVDAQALVWAAGGRALLLEAARKPLQPDLAGAGHLPLAPGSLAGAGRGLSLLVLRAINREAAAPRQVGCARRVV